MHQNITQNLTLDQIAKDMLIGRSHLQQLIRKYHNCGAIALFSKLGVEPKGMERCYYLTPYSGKGDEAMAYPAYRVGGNFYDLFYGRVMQTSIVPEYQFEPLEPGQRGSGVNAMQKQLVKLGYLDAATGLYDDSTTEAVRLFQQKNSLYEDGIAGSATLKRIYSEDAVANN